MVNKKAKSRSFLAQPESEVGKGVRDGENERKTANHIQLSYCKDGKIISHLRSFFESKPCMSTCKCAYKK
jgi:hypothetical protein